MSPESYISRERREVCLPFTSGLVRGASRRPLESVLYLQESEDTRLVFDTCLGDQEVRRPPDCI